MSEEPEYVTRLELKLDRILELLDDEPETVCPSCGGSEFVEVQGLGGLTFICSSCRFELTPEVDGN